MDVRVECGVFDLLNAGSGGLALDVEHDDPGVAGTDGDLGV